MRKDRNGKLEGRIYLSLPAGTIVAGRSLDVACEAEIPCIMKATHVDYQGTERSLIDGGLDEAETSMVMAAFGRALTKVSLVRWLGDNGRLEILGDASEGPY